MERKEPATSLVNTLGDEIGGIYLTRIEEFLILEGIMDLSVRHGTGIEPNVDQVSFTLHRIARLGDEDDIVDVRTVDVDTVVIFS